MIDKSFIEKIQELARPEVETVDGKSYATRPFYHLPDSHIVTNPLRLTSLTSFVDYLKKNIDEMSALNCMVHVENSQTVSLLGKFSDHMRRSLYVQTHNPYPKFTFDKYLEQEDFLIGLQTFFERSNMLDDLLLTAQEISRSSEQKLQDDGFTQTVTAQSGSHLLGAVKIKNPLFLTPIRTFKEVKQVESKLIFRVQEDELALFECDAGAWQVEAVKRIAAWLREKLGEDFIILS